MTDRQKMEQRQQLADLFGCAPSELVGETFGILLVEAENMGATVYWGCWTAEQLEVTL